LPKNVLAWIWRRRWLVLEATTCTWVWSKLAYPIYSSFILSTNNLNPTPSPNCVFRCRISIRIWWTNTRALLRSDLWKFIFKFFLLSKHYTFMGKKWKCCLHRSSEIFHQHTRWIFYGYGFVEIPHQCCQHPISSGKKNCFQKNN